MKHKVLLVGALVAVSAFAVLPLIAQEAPVTIPEELLKKEVKDWRLTGTTIVVGVMLLGRFLGGLRNGGGIVGAVKGILFGTNTPSPPPATPPSTPP